MGRSSVSFSMKQSNFSSFEDELHCVSNRATSFSFVRNFTVVCIHPVEADLGIDNWINIPANINVGKDRILPQAQVGTCRVDADY